MIVAISGSSGLIGTALVRMLEQRGDEVRPLVRRAAREHREIAWNPDAGAIDAGRLNGVDAVINLSGENLAQRWSQSVKRRILDSRVKGTSLLAATIAALPHKPRALLSGSAIGIYGGRGDEVLDDASSLGTDFLAGVCKAWEAATAPASDAGTRVVSLRSGLVLSPHGGVLGKLLLPFRLGIGGPVGDGRQWTSWIDIGDYVRAIARLLDHESLAGAVNLTSPNPVTNAELSHTLGRVLHRPSIVVVPKCALKLAFGEMAEGTVLASQRVLPRRLLDDGFEFSQPTIEGSLRALLSRDGSANLSA